MNAVRLLWGVLASVAPCLLVPSVLGAYEGFVAPIDEIPLTTPIVSGARALGMGGAGLAVADDASAVSSNPAALARLQRIEFAGGISKWSRSLDGAALGGDFETSFSTTNLSSVRFAYPFPTFRGSLVFGLAGDRVYDFEDDFLVTYEDAFTWDESPGVPETGPWRQTEDLLAEGGIYAWTIGAAVDASPRVSLGASVSYWTGDFSRRFSWLAEDTNDLSGNYDQYLLSVTSEADLSGLRGRVGSLFYLAQGLMGAVVVESPITVTFNGAEQVDQELDGDPFAPDVTYFTDEIELPFSFGTGLSYAPTDFIVLAADVVYVDWSEMRYEGPIYLGETSGRRSAYESATDLKLGAEVMLPSWPVRLRAGWGLRPLPYRGLEVDAGRAYFTLGGGVLIDTVLSLDVAWASESYERSAVGYDYDEATEKNIFLLEAAYRF